ncbi:MAG: hypothetical protein H0U53_10130 [Actinobacteria bacterium]|nr:hypothetical protein [Actinomycetota bacterium]
MASRLRRNEVKARLLIPDTDFHGMDLLPLVWADSVRFLERRLASPV